MTFDTLGIDVFYLALYATAPVIKLVMGGLLMLTFAEGINQAMQVLRG